MKKIVTCALAALAAACSAYTITYRDGVLRLQLEFESRSEGAGQHLPKPIVTAAGGVGEIVVGARLSAADPCQKLTAATGSPGGRTVELEVTIEPVGTGCHTVIGNYAYTARVRGLEPGTWTLRVRHLYPGTGWPSGTVLETPVTVR